MNLAALSSLTSKGRAQCKDSLPSSGIDVKESIADRRPVWVAHDRKNYERCDLKQTVDVQSELLAFLAQLWAAGAIPQTRSGRSARR